MSQMVEQLETQSASVVAEDTSPGEERTVEVRSPRRAAVDPHFDDFDYKPLPTLAPVAAFLGICSVATLVSPAAGVLPVFGIVLGLVCLRQIRRAEGQLSGRKLALSGVALSLLFLLTGGAWHSYAYATEVPEGFHRVNFYHEISRKPFVFENGVTKLHPDVAAMDGAKIFVKGYIYQSKETLSGLPFNSFLFVKDNQDCCFGANPKPTDLIVVQMAEGRQARYVNGLVSIAGEFRTKTPYSMGQQEPVYGLVDVSFVERAKSSY